MRRDLDRLDSENFDILIVGGGIHGACVAWDATLRGLRVGLIEQGDFASGTTGNSLRIAHGGLRAIQQLGFGRLRESAREQAILFRIAPGLVRPLPCLVPIYRANGFEAAAFKAAFAASRLLTSDISRDFNAPLPAPRVVSAEEAITCFDGLERSGLLAGALWYEAQVPEIERLVLGLLCSADERGAMVANYVRARRLILGQNGVTGAEVTDQLTGRNFLIRASLVLNAAGPWCAEIAGAAGSASLPQRWAQGVNVIIDRPAPPVALGVRSPWGPERDPVMGGHRFLFMTGWKGVTLAGTSYRVATGGGPSLPTQTRELLAEWNAAFPSLTWSVEEVRHQHCGKLPLRDGIQPGRSTALLDRQYLVEHEGALTGLVSLVGTKFTTARLLAERAVTSCIQRLGRGQVECTTDKVPLTTSPGSGADVPSRARFAIREEMAFTLEDLVIRRLGLGLTGSPPAADLATVGSIAEAELGWSRQQLDDQIQRLADQFPPNRVTRAA